jgi:hypothetical protein
MIIGARDARELTRDQLQDFGGRQTRHEQAKLARCRRVDGRRAHVRAGPGAAFDPALSLDIP